MSLNRPSTRPDWKDHRPGMMSQAKLKALVAKAKAAPRPAPAQRDPTPPRSKPSASSLGRRLSRAGEHALFHSKNARNRPALSGSELIRIVWVYVLICEKEGAVTLKHKSTYLTHPHTPSTTPSRVALCRCSSASSGGGSTCNCDPAGALLQCAGSGAGSGAGTGAGSSARTQHSQGPNKAGGPVVDVTRGAAHGEERGDIDISQHLAAADVEVRGEAQQHDVRHGEDREHRPSEREVCCIDP